MSNPEFQALFSRLSSTSNSTNSNTIPTSQSLDPIQTVREHGTPATAPLSPQAFPGFQTLPRSNMASSFQGSNAAGNNDRAQSLLSLLRFSQPPENQQDGELGQSTSAKILPLPKPHEQGMSEAELVKTFATTSTTTSARDADGTDVVLPFIQTVEASAARPAASTQENPQDALLRLLNRSQLSNSQTRPTESNFATSSKATGAGEVQQEPISTKYERDSSMIAQQQGDESTFRKFGSGQSRESTPFEAPQSPQIQKEKKPLFTYKNPFEALNASRSQQARSEDSQPSAPDPVVDTRESNNGTSAVNGDKRKSNRGSPEPFSTRIKLTPRVPVRLASSAQPELAEKKSSDLVATAQSHEKPEETMTLNRREVDNDLAKTQKTEMKQREDAPIPDTSGLPSEVEGRSRKEDKHQDGNVPSNKQTTKDTANDAEDGWESAEDPFAKEQHERVVPVYNFPIKPFVSISMQPSPLSEIGLRDDGLMEISRLKKDFDQLDRSLAAATSKYITYALVKNGGIRIIRQDDGNDRQVFKNSQDRIFSVAVCTTSINAAASEYQAVLGVGVSGSVYYATISKDGKDLFGDDALDSESLIFPPYPLGDENTSGGVLKTRARRSSRHPEFFAIGRGKSINLIWPATAMSTKYGVGGTSRKVDVEKLYKDRSLRITTGKAGKDFAFSEDDSLIVSLDKAGRLRFWDIRSLVEESNATASKVAPMEVRIPLLTLATASPAEKSWPTSVLFIDKLRPYTKVAALRYVLVGLKQNHTLQLWDIGLGKAVQEINFPHETETDGICSVAYHPNSGIIVVGHPTRNSIYFIHLSAPRYALTPMTQAEYLERLAIKDQDLPKPDSTACMSGIREISFSARGQLRSIELLPVHKGPDLFKAAAEALPLFELYVVHSKGVTCMNVRKEDLGWSAEGKVLHPINATEEGFITMKDLRLGTVVDEPVEADVQAEGIIQPTKSTKKKASKKGFDASDASVPSQLETPFAVPSALADGRQRQGQVQSQSNGVLPEDVPKAQTPILKESKKSKKKASAANTTLAPDPVITPGSASGTISPSKTPSAHVIPQPQNTSTINTMDSDSQPRPALQQPISATQGDSEKVTVGISGDWLNKEIKKIENAVSGEFRKELTDLYQHIQSDRNVQDAAAIARQEAVLRLISTTLSTNVEKSLQRIIMNQMQQVVVPSVTSVTVQAISAQVGEAIARVLHQLVPHELGTQLPVAINTAMQNPQMSRTISEAVSQKVSTQVESHMADLLRTKITPSFQKLANIAAEKAAAELENRYTAQLQQLRTERENDSAKVFEALAGIASTLESMSATQVDFQARILRDRDQLTQLSQMVGLESGSRSRQVSTIRQLLPPSASPILTQPKTEEEIEAEEIRKLMEDEQYEQASILWLQSSQPVELFDKLFVRFTPDYLADVSPLVAFTVGITVGNSLLTNTARRLAWINAAFEAVNMLVSRKRSPITNIFPEFMADPFSCSQDAEIADLAQHAPALINSLIQKLENVYTETAERNPNDAVLSLVLATLRKAVDMKAALSGDQSQQNAGSRYGYD